MERCTYFEHGKNRQRFDGVVYSAPFVDRLAAYEDTGLSPTDIADIRNELCLKCGKYKTAHDGSCDGCRWKGKISNGNHAR